MTIPVHWDGKQVGAFEVTEGTRHAEAGRVVVRIEEYLTADGDYFVHLSPDEARSLAQALTETADAL